ncbi:MAG: hypothetical protein GY940_35695, partial [bacterium]|nr:hypothetical protein [bacterium]
LELETPPPYINYIRWLVKQDKDRALDYWREYLSGYEQQAGLPVLGGLNSGGEDKYKLVEYQLLFDEALTSRMSKLAADSRVTLNTLFQTVWGIVLQKYNNCGDAVFGVIVSGRPAEVDGIETMIGLFINTIPVRIKSRGQQEFLQLLAAVQDEAVISKSYDYVSLAEIQSVSALKVNLIDNIMGFENFPAYEIEKNK